MYKQRQRQKDLNKKFVGKYIANVAVLNIKETFVQFVVFQFFQTRCLVCFVVWLYAYACSCVCACESVRVCV